MNIELESMAIEMPRVAGHPNREPFRGVLTLVDAASDKPPAGARGHRVLLTRTAAEAGLPSLLGMGLDYAPSLDRHDARRKVGVITRAEIVGRNLELGGYLFAKDFPEIVRENLWRIDSQDRKSTELQSRQYLVCRLLLEKKKGQYAHNFMKSLPHLLKQQFFS